MPSSGQLPSLLDGIAIVHFPGETGEPPLWRGGEAGFCAHPRHARRSDSGHRRPKSESNVVPGYERPYQFLSRKLGFDLFQDRKTLERAVVLLEIRNVIVRARGIVNDTFIQRVTDPPVPLGNQVTFSINEVRDHLAFLDSSVSEIEGRAHSKFGIKLPYKIPMRPNATRR
jgi:hypothetical protein